MFVKQLFILHKEHQDIFFYFVSVQRILRRKVDVYGRILVCGLLTTKQIKECMRKLSSAARGYQTIKVHGIA